MRRMLTALVLALPFCHAACTSYAIHLYSDPQQLQVIDDRLVLTDVEADDGLPMGVLMRGDSVVVIGERRNSWEYEQDLHDRYFIVYFGRRRAHVPFRSLVSRDHYAGMYGTRQPTAEPAQPTTSNVGPGGVAVRDTNSTGAGAPAGDLTGGAQRNRRRNR